MQLGGRLLAGLAAITLLAGGAEYREPASHPQTTHYVNRSGRKIHPGWVLEAAPLRWTAICKDGDYSFSNHPRGACFHHGGVARWR